MCVIMSKPQNVAFPEERILKNCWDNNPDMGGFMYTLNGNVYIQKGYTKWEEFKSALDNARKKYGDDIPYVCHFRISTQGYDKACCQPFPLSSNMKKLKKEKSESNIGVAHNGILALTSDGSKDYSDTMLFITEYLVNIIRSYDWYKDKRTVKLIENLIDGSRFAILDKTGHCQLMGRGWIEDNGVSYSNSTYSYKKQVYTSPVYRGCGVLPTSNGGYGLWDDYYESDDKRWQDYWEKTTGSKSEAKKTVATHSTRGYIDDDYLDEWDNNWNPRTRMYDFSSLFCPYSVEDDDGYCECCSQYGKCPYTLACRSAVNEN